MGATRNKNSIATWSLVMSSVLVGDVVFGVGIYVPVLLAMATGNRWAYWQGVVVAVILSLTKGVSVGAIGIVMWLVIYLHSLLVTKFRPGWLVVGLYVLSANWVIDRLFGFNWGFVEGVLVLIVVWIFSQMGYFKEELRVNG